MAKAVMKKTKTLAAENELSMSSVYKILRFIESEIGDRYPVGSVVHYGRILRIRDDVFKDALTYGDAVRAGLAPEFVDSCR